mgnify:CR=1 FL=1
MLGTKEQENSEVNVSGEDLLCNYFLCENLISFLSRVCVCVCRYLWCDGRNPGLAFYVTVPSLQL